MKRTLCDMRDTDGCLGMPEEKLILDNGRMTRPQGDVGHVDNPVSHRVIESYKTIICNSYVKEQCVFCDRMLPNYYFCIRVTPYDLDIWVCTPHVILSPETLHRFIKFLGFKNFCLYDNQANLIRRDILSMTGTIFVVDGYSQKLAVDWNQLMHALNGNTANCDIDDFPEVWIDQGRDPMDYEPVELDSDGPSIDPNTNRVVHPIKTRPERKNAVDKGKRKKSNPQKKRPIKKEWRIVPTKDGVETPVDIPKTGQAIGTDKGDIKKQTRKREVRNKLNNRNNLKNANDRSKFYKNKTPQVYSKVTAEGDPVLIPKAIDLAAPVMDVPEEENNDNVGENIIPMQDQQKDVEKAEEVAKQIDFPIRFFKTLYCFAYYSNIKTLESKPKTLVARFYKYFAENPNPYPNATLAAYGVVTLFCRWAMTLSDDIASNFIPLLTLMMRDRKRAVKSADYMGSLLYGIFFYWMGMSIVAAGKHFMYRTAQFKVIRSHHLELMPEQKIEWRDADNEFIPNDADDFGKSPNPNVDLRREADLTFQNKLAFKAVKYIETVRDTYEYGHNFGMFKWVKHETVDIEVSPVRTADAELLTQMTNPRNISMNNSAESLIERLGNSNGPMINYDRADIFEEDVNANTSRLATGVVLSARCDNLKTCVYESLFRKADQVRLRLVPGTKEPRPSTLLTGLRNLISDVGTYMGIVLTKSPFDQVKCLMRRWSNSHQLTLNMTEVGDLPSEPQSSLI